MDIKLIVTDMDGTLLNSKHELNDFTIDKLKHLEELGIKLLLASGRSIKTLEGFGKKLAMDQFGGYYVCVNGAKITYAKDLQTHVLNQFKAEDIKDIMNFVKPYEVEIMAVQDGSIYDYIPESLMEIKRAYRKEKNISDDIPFTAGTFDLIVDQRKGYDYIEYVKDIDSLNISSNKLCIAHEKEVIDKVYDALVAHYKDQYTFAKTSPRWLEVAPKGIDKAKAIRIIMDEMKIDSSNVIVCGDGENDLSMFKVSDYKIAMKNGMDSVKAQASVISDDDNNNDGMVKAVYQLLGIEI